MKEGRSQSGEARACLRHDALFDLHRSLQKKCLLRCTAARNISCARTWRFVSDKHQISTLMHGTCDFVLHLACRPHPVSLPSTWSGCFSLTQCHVSYCDTLAGDSQSSARTLLGIHHRSCGLQSVGGTSVVGQL